MEHLEDLLFKYDFQKRTSVSAATTGDIQRKLNFPLPEDYKYFLDNYSEAYCFIGPAYVHLWDLDNLLDSNNGYEIQKWLDNTIGIGSNGAGECIAIELLGPENYRIVLTPFIFEEECHIEIGTSFTDMLIRLDNGIEWFN